MKNKLTPLRAIRKYCVKACCPGQPKEVLHCPVDHGPLFIFRFGKKKIPENAVPVWYCGRSGQKEFVPVSKLTSLKAIKFKCLDCSAGYLEEVKTCLNEDCYLFPFRLGRNPALKGRGNASYFHNKPIQQPISDGKKKMSITGRPEKNVSEIHSPVGGLP